PLDPFGLMSFLSLTIKPLEERLARDMAQLLANAPGLGNTQWHTMIGHFIKRLEEDEVPDRHALIRQYRFWFERTRYNPTDGAPVSEAIKLYEYLFQWAKQIAAEQTDPNNLNLLTDQTRRVIELLENRHLPTITKLELEQMVKAIHEPASIQLAPTQVGMHPPVYYPHAITQDIDQLVWWNFIQYEPDYFFSKWYQSERRWLQHLSPSIELETPAQANQQWVQFRKTAIRRTQKQLILIIPEIAEGQETLAHPLMGDLEATFQDIQPFTIHIDNPSDIHKLSAWLEAPEWNTFTPPTWLPAEPFIQMPTTQSVAQRDKESVSSLEDLFYYPHKWVFRYTAKWRPSPILSIVQEKTLFGNLAHRFVELVFAEKAIEEWTQQELHTWINSMAHPLLQQEGSVLLLYGKEPQKLQFLNQVKSSVWNLIDLLKSNQWTNAQTEVALTGQLGNTPVLGRADLVLERGYEKLIIDLKWSGTTYRRDQIKSKEDLQLVLYSHMMAPGSKRVYAGFYILSTGQMVARSNEPFPQIEAVLPQADYQEIHNEILDKMKKTLVWRMAQLKSGKIELRMQATADDLAEAYRDEPLLELLEMKTEDASFDDYKTLMGYSEEA
ncbi:MAG: PD-(D/E)XK nuclease family protein, partial [Saprospiraceae bacterium]|nr:PD-(D/E)XK nuclease family protein [Saprospiraceae bacterium]